MVVGSKAFERAIWKYIQPVDGKNGMQLPRPWFTKFDNPLVARIFVVGANQKNGFDPNSIDIHRHFDGLFNRNGETCNGIYREATGGKESLTRKRIQAYITGKLEERDITDVLETNVVCRSSPQFSDLDKGEKEIGSEVFRYLLNTVRPRILIIFGKGARQRFAESITLVPAERGGIDTRLRKIVPNKNSVPTSVSLNDNLEVFCVPGLVMAGWNEWSGWIDAYTDKLADEVAKRMNAVE